MIGKIAVGKSFSGCINYCLQDKKVSQNEERCKNRAEVILYNNCGGDARELVQQFNEVRQLNRKITKPVMHITLSLAPGEKLGKDKLMEVCEHAAKEMGFENNQFIAVSHSDTMHQHIHIVANRIGFDKRTVSDSNSYKKVAHLCRKMELKYELKQVLNPKRYLSRELRNIPKFDLRKENMRRHIRSALQGCRKFEEFEQKMNASGYQVTRGRGISFTDEKKVKVKGSDLNYSLQTIERILQRQNGLPINPVQKSIPANIMEPKIPSPTYEKFSNLVGGKQEGLVQELLKPQNDSGSVVDDFEENKKKKKSQSHH